MKEKLGDIRILPPNVQTKSLCPRPRRKKFRPDIKTANAVLSAVVFLQKSGIAGTPKNIKICMRERSKKVFDLLHAKLPLYLSRGLELGILRRYNGTYKLGNFELKRRKRHYMKTKWKTKSKIHRKPSLARTEIHEVQKYMRSAPPKSTSLEKLLPPKSNSALSKPLQKVSNSSIGNSQMMCEAKKSCGDGKRIVVGGD